MPFSVSVITSFKSRCALIAVFAVMAAPPAVSQSADALAIPVRKNGDETSGENSPTASAEKEAARRLTSRLRVDSPAGQTAAPKADENAPAPQPAPLPPGPSPVIESRMSLYNMEGAEIPSGLLRKRTGNAAAPGSNTSQQKNQPAPQQKTQQARSSDSTNKPAPQQRNTAVTTKSPSENQSEKPEKLQRNNEPRRTASSSSNNEKSSQANRESNRRSVTDSDSTENSAPNDIQQEANQAALDNLRPSSSPSDNTMMANAPAMPPRGFAPTIASTPALTAELERPDISETQQPASQHPPDQDTPQVQTAMTAPPAPPSPNLYLPQATPAPRRGSILSRLFNRDNQQPARVQSTVMEFNSDYATRDSDDVCPVVLPGLGINGRDIPYGQEDAYRLTSSLPAHFRPTDLVRLPTEYCHYGNALYLRREAAASLCQMINDAARQGLTIRVVSAFRDYDHQLRLYTRAVSRGGENQKSVARPGRSEHYLGTTVDLTNNEDHALKRSFGDTPEGRWLANNAARYGYKLTVMSSSARRSHNDEPWHLRYLGSSINNPSPGISPIAQQRSQSQPPGVFGKIGRFLGLRR